MEYKSCFFMLILTLALSQKVNAKEYTIHNSYTSPVYAAIYKAKGRNPARAYDDRKNKAEMLSKVVSIPAGGMATINFKTSFGSNPKDYYIIASYYPEYEIGKDLRDATAWSDIQFSQLKKDLTAYVIPTNNRFLFELASSKDLPKKLTIKTSIS